MNTLVFDLGGMKCDAAVFDEYKNLLKKERILTKAEEGKDIVIQQIFDLAQKFVREFVVQRCVIGVPGKVEKDRKTILVLPNIRDFKNVNLGKIFEQKFPNLQCLVENDANLFALGAFASLQSKPEVLVGITLGTGIGGGIVMNGKLWRGAGGLAGEFGHMVIADNGILCHCGQKGCFEKYASAQALIHKVEALNLFTEKVTTELIAEALDNKNTFVLEKVQETVDFLALGLSNLIHVLDPDMIALGGSLGKLLPYYQTDLTRKIEARLLAKQMNCKICSIQDENVQLRGGLFLSDT